MSGSGRQATNAKKLPTQQSVNAAVKQICDIMRRSNCARALQYVPELTWILFLRILDEREEIEADEARAVGAEYKPSLTAPSRWRDWAAPDGPKRAELQEGALDAFFKFLHKELLPHVRELGEQPQASSRQKGNAVYPIALANLVLHGIDAPHIWHSNTLTGTAAHDGLFAGAPPLYDVILMNPPFGGKEGKDAQTRFAYKTGATQVLFLQHVIDSLRPPHGDEVTGGRLRPRHRRGRPLPHQRDRLRANQAQAACDLWCIVSMPLSVFSQAGAGLKTNLLFFNKGLPTTRIWYFDLKAVNPHRVLEENTRTPEELLDEIERQQKIIAAAIAELRRL